MWCAVNADQVSVSTIGGKRGYVDSAPGDGTKTASSGGRTTDPLHGWQACLEFNSFHQGVGQISPRERLLS